ncbi:OpgC domain-containing protein [Alteromonas sp. HB246098]
MRDNRIDLIRGFAMVTICVNHITWMLGKVESVGQKIPTLTHYGYSSAAEIFFFMSGYMVGMVYLNKPDMRAKLLGRAFHLYRINIALFLLLAALSFVSPNMQFLQLTGLDHLSNNFPLALVQYLLFFYCPMFTDLLLTYVILLTVSVPFSKLLKMNAMAFIVVITGLYIFSQYFPTLKLSNVATFDGKWSFNLFSYQFLFMLGVFAGHQKLINQIFEKVDKNTVLWSALSMASLVGFYAIKRYDLLGLKGQLWLAKESLGPIRILHFFVVITALMSMLSLFKKVLNIWPLTVLALIGRQSLTAFCVSVVSCYIALAIWTTNSRSQVLYFTLALLAVAAIALCSYLVELKKKSGRKWHSLLIRTKEAL